MDPGLSEGVLITPAGPSIPGLSIRCLSLNISRDRSLVLSETLHEVGSKKSDTAVILISFKNHGFVWTSLRTPVIKSLTFCMMVQGNRVHHLGMVPYLGKILILD